MRILSSRSWRRGLLACALAATGASWAAHKVQNTPVAWVNGEAIERTTLVELLNQRNAQGDTSGRPLPPVTLADRQKALDDIIQMALVAQKAHAEGLSTTPEAQAELAFQRDQVLGQRLLRLMVQETVVDEAAVRARYDTLVTEHTVSVRHVLLADEASARAVIGQLDGGADFADVARRQSLDRDTREQGGLLPTANASAFAAAFADAAATLPLGRHGARPVHTDFGWHVLRVESRKAAPPAPFDEAREWLAPQIANERVEAQVAAWRQAADVRVLQPIEDGPPAATGGDVATVDGRPVSRLALEQLVKARNGLDNPYDPVDPQRSAPPLMGRAATLDELVTTEVLAHQARVRRLDENPSVMAEVALQTKTAAGRLYVRHLIAQTKVRRDELEALYRTDVATHDYKLSQIVAADEATARDAIARLDKGARFPTVARALSTDEASKGRGGSLGWMLQPQLPPDVAAAVRRLRPGRHTAAPVQTEVGWVVVRLDALRPATERPGLDEAAAWLYPKLMHTKVQAQLQQLRAAADVRVVR